MDDLYIQLINREVVIELNSKDKGLPYTYAAKTKIVCNWYCCQWSNTDEDHYYCGCEPSITYVEEDAEVTTSDGCK